MLKGLTWLLALQLAGNLLSAWWLPMLPGAVIGMLLLFGYLLIHGKVDEPLNQAASGLLNYLPLLLVPAAGIMLAGDALREDGLAIGVALVLSLLVSIPFCGWLMQRLTRRIERKAAEPRCPRLIHDASVGGFSTCRGVQGIRPLQARLAVIDSSRAARATGRWTPRGSRRIAYRRAAPRLRPRTLSNRAADACVPAAPAEACR